MSVKKVGLILMAFAATLLLSTSLAFAQKYEVLTGTTFGTNPTGGLVADAAGNLYGTTQAGGSGEGSVFELSPPAILGGAWTETTLYSFGAHTPDANVPMSTLVFDKQGNLYGTTGASTDGYGAVFELSPPTSPGGAWTETVLYDFPIDGSHGGQPEGKLLFDAAGNLYGTTGYGGTGHSCATYNTYGCGTIFRLSPPSSPGGAWKQTVLFNFGNSKSDGAHPGGALTLHNGVFYGTTVYGGATDNGTVFQLAAQNGHWVETRLHDFSGADGAFPASTLIRDLAGNLYGTTSGGGTPKCSGTLGCGTVFELSPPLVSGDPWQETILHTFAGGSDGGASYAALIMDKAGNLYGTGSAGGFKNNGVVFKLKAPASPGGAYTNVILHVFDPPAGDGGNPYGELIRFDGRLYGTTWAGGAGHFGTVFSVLP